MAWPKIRLTINTLLTLLAVSQVVLLVFRGAFTDYLDTLVPIVTLLTALGLVAFWYQNRIAANRARLVLSQREQLRQEVRALNKHALVCLTDTDFKIIYVNEAFQRATGYGEAELLDQPMDLLHFPEDAQAVEDLRRSMGNGKTWQGENRLRAKNGSELWTELTFMPGLNSVGKMCSSISVRTDISEVKRLEADKDVFEALRSIHDQIYIFDMEDLVCKYANIEARKSMPNGGLTTVDATICEVDPSFASDAFHDAMKSLLESDNGLVQFSIDRNGKSYNAQLQRMSNKSGGKDALLVLRDVTDQVEAERVRTEFISTVSHELRSPMTSIKGSLGLILAGSAGEVSPTARHMLEIAHRNSDRLVHIINDLLDIEKIAAGRMSFELGSYDLVSIANEAILASDGYSKRFDVTIERAGAPQALVQVDFDRTLQVINNLLSNATKFSKAGGKVIVRIEENDDAVTLEVQDFGKGIPMAFQKKVFEKFATKQNTRDAEIRGSGLGLAIVKAIVEQQSGTISFESTEGVGTTFRVVFPTAAAYAARQYPEALERAAQ